MMTKSEIMKKRWQDPEFRKKMSQSCSVETKEKIRKKLKGRKRTEIQNSKNGRDKNEK